MLSVLKIMSFVSIRCPYCAATETIPVGENQYKCRNCDHIFNYVNPDAPKMSKNITVQEVQSHQCAICGRGVTAGTSNRCMKCGTNDLCSNCVSETQERKLNCKNCIAASLHDCLECGNYSILRCVSCMKLHQKDQSHVVTRYCSEHLSDYFEKYHTRYLTLYACSYCDGLLCKYCHDSTGWQSGGKKKCKNCGKKSVEGSIIDCNIQVSTQLKLEKILEYLRRYNLTLNTPYL